MGIRDRQLTNETKKILQKELLAGRYPDLSAVQDMVAERFKDRPAGLPRFRLKPVRNKEVSSADSYNDMIHALHEDLSTSFEEVRYQGDRMMALADYYETEKLRINLQTKQLNRRMELLKDRLENRGLRDVVFNTFHDFVEVEFNGDKTRNIPATNTFIDLRHGWTGLDEIRAGSKKVNLATAHASVKPISQFADFIQLSSIDNCLKDTINESWRHQGIMSEPKPASIIYQVELKETIDLNMISFTPQSGRPMKVVLLTSVDGENFDQHLVKTVSQLTEWNFNTKQVRYIQFALLKTEPDFSSGAEYHYYFGAENISARQVLYKSSGYLVSKPHKIERVVDKLMLKVDEVIHPGTAIDYFIAEDRMDGGVLEWEVIEPGKTTVFNGLETDELLVNSTFPNYGEFYQRQYNHNYFGIAKLDKKPTKRTINILVGHGMYQVDSMPLTDSMVGTLDSWKSAREYTTSFISLNETVAPAEMAVAANRMERMTTHITMAKDYTLHANPVSIGHGMKARIYLNNIEIRPIEGDYTYQFRKGLNKLEIIYTTTEASHITPNLGVNYLRSIGATDIYAQAEGMEQVDLYDLLNNTSKKDQMKFAIDDTNRIVVNYNPKALDKSGNGVAYKLTYRYPADESQSETYIRFMAKLYLTDNLGDVSPVLKSYKLIIE